MSKGFEQKKIDLFHYPNLIKSNGSKKNNIVDQEFDGINDFELPILEKTIILEKEKTIEGKFHLSPIVREYRGIAKQEIKEREILIKEEVERRIELIRQEGFDQGFEQGIEEGKNEIYQQTRQMTEDKIGHLTKMIEEILLEKEKILNHEKMEIYQLVRSLTKWIILRELKDDGEYIKRLLEKLITELGSRQDLLVQVNRDEFEAMPEVLKFVENKIGELKNVRIESDSDVALNGFVVTSENGIINGTLQEQFNQLDRLFETVGLHSDE